MRRSRVVAFVSCRRVDKHVKDLPTSRKPMTLRSQRITSMHDGSTTQTAGGPASVASARVRRAWPLRHCAGYLSVVDSVAA